ncbi:hypothetical protein LL06_01060 [Hoeflea sp. BAL378]|uniref:hypothetical protein n=1 Tax=Hoeflea sp. BAL378 TaxID=1547437 RepID=UPI00051407BA|nr:hypothetical protein [Hoeflea sp. BAL378]KGF71211.1 hypothetical protein LL06_01060 [Hoeflea sp. BAL378]
MASDNRITISGGRDVSISGAVGTNASVRRTVALGDGAVEALAGQFRLIEGEIAKEATRGHLPDHVKTKLIDELGQIGNVMVDGAQEPEVLKGRLVSFIDKVNFCCTTAESVSLITKAITSAAALVGLAL